MFRPTSLAVLSLALPVFAATARGQSQTVQLPTFNVTGVSTTVLVPDRGSAYLGGINSARYGSSSFGAPILPGDQRAFGVELSATRFGVSAWIHDFEAMDAALLGEAAETGRRTPERVVRRVVRGDARGDAQRDEPAAVSVADLERRRAEKEATRADESARFFERGRSAEAAGKTGVARIYYRMAHSRAGGEFKSQIAARMDALGSERVARSR